jgi:hypothetical protein
MKRKKAQVAAMSLVWATNIMAQPYEKKQGKSTHAHSLPSQNSSSVARESMCPTISSQPREKNKGKSHKHMKPPNH